MANQCEITKVAVRIGKKEQTITIDEAKALKAALEELFGKAVIERVEHHYHRVRPRYWWQATTKTLQADGRERYTLECKDDNKTALLSV